jgi:hypothetical protein
MASQRWMISKALACTNGLLLDDRDFSPATCRFVTNAVELELEAALEKVWPGSIFLALPASSFNTKAT